MSWFSWGGPGNELGEHLPDDEATLQEGSEIIEAKGKDAAKKECKEIASVRLVSGKSF